MLVSAVFMSALSTLLNFFAFSSEVSAQEETACTRTISSGDPLEEAANSLGPGDVLCLRGGEYTDPDEIFKVTAAGTADERIELRSYPGEQATLEDHLWLNEQANNVTVRGLNLTSTYLNTLTVYGDDVWVIDNDITNPQEICVLVGAYRSGVLFGVLQTADRALLQGNRLHDCGGQSTNHRHGIYVNSAKDTEILDNEIYDNADRGIQLYPDAQRTLIKGNVIDGNGEGINIGGKGVYSTSNTTVTNNVISNSKVRWNVESYWEQALKVGTGNVVQNNCLYASNSNSYYNGNGGITTNEPLGFTAKDNIVADPEFIDRANKDFRPRPGSPCAMIPGGAQGSSPVPESVEEGEGVAGVLRDGMALLWRAFSDRPPYQRS